MIYLSLCIEFFKIGLFAIGGGLATIPFLSELGTRYGWFTTEMLTNMIAVSVSTPGPIGVNMATFSGYHAAHILGGILATLSLIAPSIIIIILVAQVLEKFKESDKVQAIFYGLRPAVTALITVSAIQIFSITFFNTDLFLLTRNIFDLFHILSIVLFIILYFLYRKYKCHPIYLILGCAILGILFQL